MWVKICILMNICFIFVECIVPGIQPELSVQRMDKKLIQKKRQDTRDMCRIFTEETRKLNQIIKSKYPKKKHVRAKRAIAEQALNPALNLDDAQRVESIVDKMYDDLEERGEKVEYRRADITAFMKNISDNSKESATKSARKFNFAPAILSGPKVTHKPFKEPEITTPNSKAGPRFAHGIVPYFIDSRTYDTHLAEVIMKAFDYFEKVTCIRLQRLRERPTDRESLQKVEWLYITNPTGIKQCVHSNDRTEIKGVQMIVFGYNCMSLGDITHEIMHVLGFSHEHTRPDRDHYITILWDNIKPGYKKYFELLNKPVVENLPYDYASVLHYPPRAFSRNGQVTIMTQPGVKVGQREGLSEIDVEKISAVYSAECVKRNREYLLKTCPSVVKNKPESKPVNITKKEIEKYYEDRLWTYAIVNYRLRDKMEFSNEERENINAVIRHIEKETCIEFRDLTSDPHATIEVEEESSEARSTGTETANEKGTGTEKGTGSEKGSGTGSEKGSGTEKASGTEKTSGTEKASGTEKGSGTGSEKGSETGSEKGSGTGSEKGSGTEKESKKEKGTSSGSDKGSGKLTEITDNRISQASDKSSAEEENNEEPGELDEDGNQDHSSDKAASSPEASDRQRGSESARQASDTATGTEKRAADNAPGRTGEISVKSWKKRFLKRKKAIYLKRDGSASNPTTYNKTRPGIHPNNNKPGGTNKKQTPISPSRRHATNILILTRSANPGCACPKSGVPGTVTVRHETHPNKAYPHRVAAYTSLQNSCLGKPTVEINADCFNSVNDLLHLFVHILGLDHQHNSYDRDSYLHIVWDQLTDKVKHDMEKKLPPAASVGFPYDYQSVMHYPWLQIKNGRTNIMYPIWNDGWAMGHWQGLSSIDVQKLNLLYYKQCMLRRQQADEAELRMRNMPK